MKFGSFVVFLFFYHIVIGQDYDCPCPLVSPYNCQYPRQTGELDVIKNDSLKITILKTNETELIVPEDLYSSSVYPDIMPPEYYRDPISPLDLIVNLFKNGLLTTDLLLKEYNRKMKFINKKGDTLNDTKHENSKVAEIRSITRKKYTHHSVLEISIVFKSNSEDSIKCPYCMPTINDFDIKLSKDHKRPLTKGNIEEYLKGCTIECLSWRGVEI